MQHPAIDLNANRWKEVGYSLHQWEAKQRAQVAERVRPRRLPKLLASLLTRREA